MRTPRRAPLTRVPGNLHEVSLELLSKGLDIENRIRFRGVFSTHNAIEMVPPPAPGDLWIQYDPDSGDVTAYLQLSVRPRSRVYWGVEAEPA